ncbi:tyrosine-type recombinase/integrase [archaeon]|nr:tyrosine-type recombinase/integrase [archaeon]
MGKIDYYSHETKIKQLEESVAKDSRLSKRNKELIKEFEKHLLVLGLSKSRIYKYLYMLKLLGRQFKKDFDKLNKEDIVSFVAELNSKNLSEWTKSTYKIILKRFMKWAKGYEDKKEYPPEVNWIPIKISKSNIKLPNEGDLLKEEDIKTMIERNSNIRDKALISVLWESGARIGEIGTIQIKDIVFDNYGAQVNIMGKTGARKIRLISSIPYLAQWLSIHPNKNNRDSYVWVTKGINSKIISYGFIRKILTNSARISEINKRINPHSFRHSRATFLANHMTEFQMNQYFGWVQGSNMPSTYVHLSGKNTEDVLLKLNGIMPKIEVKPSILQPKNCSRCNMMNAQDNKFCSKCGGVLDIETAIEVEKEQQAYEQTRGTTDKMMNYLFKDPEVISLFLKKVKELELQAGTQSRLPA